MQRIGFIGLGLMGRPMSRNILKAGFPMTVWNRSSEKAKETLDAGAKWADTPRAVAEASDIVITMVTDAAAAEKVICGKDGVLEGAHKGLILVDMSSIAPEMSRSLAARAEEKGVSMLDAPVTGSPKVAEAGKLGIMIGGPEKTFQACQAVFEAMSAKIVYVGPENGQGTTLKLVNNLIMGVAIQASAEALVLASKAGIDPRRVIEITQVGGARTGAMETRGPWMVNHQFDPHFTVNNMYKDLTTAVKLAEKVGASLPTTSVAVEMLRAVKSQGHGDMDSCIVLTIMENMANTSIKVKD